MIQEFQPNDLVYIGGNTMLDPETCLTDHSGVIHSFVKGQAVIILDFPVVLKDGREIKSVYIPLQYLRHPCYN